MEPIDPVRYITNHLVGQNGLCHCRRAGARRGAEVTLLSGRTALPTPEGVEKVETLSAADMYAAATKRWSESDGAVMCAAVADYTPARTAATKIKKGDGDMSILLRRTEDIAATLGRDKGGRLLAGFALETDNELANAEAKLAKEESGFHSTQLDARQRRMLPRRYEQGLDHRPRRPHRPPADDQTRGGRTDRRPHRELSEPINIRGKMLQHLSIDNYLLIDRLEIDWDRGLNIITGETGAGKSILLGALGLLLGSKNEGAAIRDTSRNCIIEAAFDIEGYGLEELFADSDLDFESPCTIRRIITPAGKSRAFVGDVPVQLSTLRQIGTRLIDIHSQHQNLVLASEEFRTRVLRHPRRQRRASGRIPHSVRAARRRPQRLPAPLRTRPSRRARTRSGCATRSRSFVRPI